MKVPHKLKFLAVALSAAGIAAMTSTGAHAEAVTDTAAPFSAAARLDFRIIIPGFLRFRVGTNSATIDMITFDMTASPANVGNSVSQTGTGGDAGGSGANVLVQANNGQVTITETNSSVGLGLGTGTASDGYISYTQISTTVSGDALLTAPTLSNAGSGTSTPTLNFGKVTNRTAVWTFGYANTTIPSAGTYGTNTNGGRVTYTATTP